MTGTGSRAVRFDRYGDRSVLYVTDVPVPVPEDGEVVVEVKAAAINPGEAAIRSGALADRFPATFPSGEGSDLAGIVSAVGHGVDEFAVGDRRIRFLFSPLQPCHLRLGPDFAADPQASRAELGGCRVPLRRRLHRLCGRTCR